MAQLLQRGRTMKTAAARERAIPEERRAERGFEWPDRAAEQPGVIQREQTEQAEYRKALERELRDALAARRRAEGALRDVVQTLSREMRTPLAAILGWLRVVNEEPLDQASTRRALEVIERNARVQLNLIDDLLADAASVPASIPTSIPTLNPGSSPGSMPTSIPPR
jgi:signal transduction histidine kinase